MSEADRAWLTEMIRSTVDAVVSSHLAPITQRLDGMVTREAFAAAIESFAAAIAELKEMVYDSDTKLLTEFHKWAGPADQKMRSHREALRALDLQIEEIAGRVKALEDRMEQRN